MYFRMLPQSGPAMTPNRRIPVGEIKNDARKETGFEHTEKETRDIELHRCFHEHHRRGGKPPQHHDAQQRLARADSFEQQVAGDFEKKITEEEDARAEAVDGIAEGERLLHLQLRVADVDTIEIRDHVGDQKQWDQSPADLRIHRMASPRDGKFCESWKVVAWALIVASLLRRLPSPELREIQSSVRSQCIRQSVAKHVRLRKGCTWPLFACERPMCLWTHGNLHVELSHWPL
jgi:hypothetical protein